MDTQEGARQVFPAYAGVSPLQQFQQHRERRLPRLRGGEPHATGENLSFLESSPPTRG